MKARSIALEVTERRPEWLERSCLGSYASKRECDSCPVERWCREISLEYPLLLGC